jgi:hypothetical protein
MNKLILAGLLLLSPAVLAEDAGAVTIEMSSVVIVGSVDAGGEVDAGVVDAGVVDAGVVVVVPSLDAPLDSAKGFYHAVTTGNGWLAAMFMLFFLVGALRIVGKRVHAMIPDDTTHVILRPIEKVLTFCFETKVGGWLLNWLSAIGGCLASTHLAGHVVDAESWKVAFLASTGGTALIELKDDVMEWWDKKNAEKAAAKAAEAEAKKTVVASDAPTPPAGNPTPETPTTPENPVEPPKA